MFAKPRKRNSLTLSQSNTGLCNIPNNASSCNIDKRKSRRTKTKPNKRRSKKHQHITNHVLTNGKSISKRSQSRPRLSQARLFEIDDKEISLKKKKKTEFIVNRDKLKQKRNSFDMKHTLQLINYPSNKTIKKNNLKRIKENRQSKVSHKKKLFKHKKQKHFKTESLYNNNTKLKNIKHINTNSDIDELNFRYKPEFLNNNSDITNIKRSHKKLKKKHYARPRNKSTPNEYINTKPSYKYRGRGRNIKDNNNNKRSKHTYSESHDIDLNITNEIFKQQRSKSSKTLRRNVSFHYNRNKNKKKKCKKKMKIKMNKTLEINHGKIRSIYKEDISPIIASPISLNYINEKQSLCNTISTYNSSDIDSNYSSYTDSDIEYFNSFELIKPPRLNVVYSPKINEAVFIGYKIINKPSYTFRGKGKYKNDINININNDKLIEIPKPLTPKFTFRNFKSKYKPNRIKWSKQTGFTDDEIDTDDDNHYEYSDNISIVTFSDNDSQYSDNNINNHNNNNNNIKINKLLSDLLGEHSDISDSFGDKQNNNENFKMSFNINSQSPSISSIFDDDIIPNDGELLFDFNSFVNNLSHKRSTYD